MTSLVNNTSSTTDMLTGLTPELAAQATVILGQSIDFPEPDQMRHCPQAALVIDRGRIAWHGPVAELPVAHQDFASVENYGEAWILPGLIDTHVHAAQMPVIASWGEQLLD
ncbi:MAG: hypothetical protein WD601_06535, partial [Pseudohongiellaceae bacterium]